MRERILLEALRRSLLAMAAAIQKYLDETKEKRAA
jgi:hypothetical protein